MTNLEELENMIAIQSTDGNWNYCPYMHGLANGLILARAVMIDEEPIFLERPHTWLENDPRPLTTQDVGSGSND
jgi:hypothetical protein